MTPPAPTTPAPTPPTAPQPAGTDVLARPHGSVRRAWSPARPAVVSTGSAARFAERVAMRRRITRDRILWAVGIAVAVAGVGWVAFGSPLLALDTTQVQVVGQGQVVDAAAVAAVVATYDGIPLPRLDTVGLRREVLDVPGVRAAEVARVWPHGLTVTVVAREPVAAVPQASGGVALLDVEGVQVGRADVAPESLPVIDVPLDDPDARALTAVLTVLQAIPAELAAQVSGASAQNQDTVELVLRDGPTVVWGSADESTLKARVLATLRASAASAGVKVYDVSAPRLPITRS